MSKKKMQYRIGDIVACYAVASNDVDDKGMAPKHVVIGWIENCNQSMYGNMYHIRWSDRIDAEAMHIPERDLEPMVELVNKVRRNEVDCR